MNSVQTMLATIRNMELDLVGLMFGYWILCIPFVFYVIRKTIHMVRKLY